MTKEETISQLRINLAEAHKENVKLKEIARSWNAKCLQHAESFAAIKKERDELYESLGYWGSTRVIRLLDLRDGIWIVVLVLMGFSFFMGFLLGGKVI